MSPEICAAERYSHHSDIWSLGCIIYELASRCVPFDARNHVELIMKIKAGKIRPLPVQYSRELGEIIGWCLKVDPRQRPDTAQLLNVANIKLARTRLQQIEHSKDIKVERDTALAQLAVAQKQIQDLTAEVQQLREHAKKVEMEWHARATLAIDQRVHEQVGDKTNELLEHFNTAVDRKAEQKLSLHLASLPQAMGSTLVIVRTSGLAHRRQARQPASPLPPQHSTTPMHRLCQETASTMMGLRQISLRSRCKTTFPRTTFRRSHSVQSHSGKGQESHSDAQRRLRTIISTLLLYRVRSMYTWPIRHRCVLMLHRAFKAFL